MKYMFSKMTMNEDGTATMPKWAVDRWSRQMNTKYSDMPESEKESDRAEADHILSIIKANKKMKKYSKQERDKFLTDALTGEDVETRQDKIRTDLHKEILRDEDQDPSASN